MGSYRHSIAAALLALAFAFTARAADWSADAIAPLLPERAQGVGRPITDRALWDALAKTPEYAAIIGSATKIAAEPIPDQPDELYLDYSKTGNRDRWQSVAFDRRSRLTTLVLAECAQNRGAFVPKIVEYVDALCAERAWTWPAHDRSLAVFNGKGNYIDLGAAELGWQMATVPWLLGDKLPAAQREKIKAEVTRRLVQPYLACATGKAAKFNWMTITNNWNAVCHAGVVGAILATADDRQTRAVAIASAAEHMKHFLGGFTADGYCSEGLGYWNYGFGHFVQLAETVRQATGGKFDLFDQPAVAMPAQFGRRIQMMNGVAPALADCAVYPRPAPQIMWYVNRRMNLGWRDCDQLALRPERNYLPEEVLYRSIEQADLPPAKQAQSKSADSPLRTWFDSAGVLIARPGPQHAGCKLAVTLKGGHNAEHHNHNDLGTFVVVVGDKYLVADPGPERYTARTFSGRRYESKLLSSYGHPVPVVAGQLQREGGQAKARIVKAEFTDEQDTLSLDLTSAYAVPELKRLTRTFVYSRAGAGQLTVTDEVEFDSPQAFAEALITLGKAQARGSGTVRLTDTGHAVEVRLDAGDRAVAITPEVIREDAKVAPTRVGIALTEKVQVARVVMTVTPVERP